MSAEEEPGGWAKLAAFAGMALGGGILGSLVGRLVAPDSGLSGWVSMAMLPVALVTGLGLWLKVALLAAVVRLVARLFGRRARSGPPSPDTSLPPGAVMLLVTSVGTSLAAGCVVSLLSTAATLGPTVGLYGLVGTAFGFAMWQLARRGYLQPSDEA